VASTPEDGRVAAIAAELAPYAWRGLTVTMLARRVVGAMDHHAVLGFVTSVPGAAVGPVHPVEPADLCDPRVEVLVRVLELRRWRSSTLDRLSVDVVAILDAWLAHHLFPSRRAVDDC
jgi:hypothetical protein